MGSYCQCAQLSCFSPHDGFPKRLNCVCWHRSSLYLISNKTIIQKGTLGPIEHIERGSSEDIFTNTQVNGMPRGILEVDKGTNLITSLEHCPECSICFIVKLFSATVVFYPYSSSSVVQFRKKTFCHQEW